jgi:hypothetical protein
MANEKRLISADMAKEMIANHANEFSDVLNRREKALLIGGGTSCIDKCPTVDAVEVVRCKDCKHYKPQSKSAHWQSTTHYCCRCAVVKVNPDDFCSYGERKEEK